MAKALPAVRGGSETSTYNTITITKILYINIIIMIISGSSSSSSSRPCGVCRRRLRPISRLRFSRVRIPQQHLSANFCTNCLPRLSTIHMPSFSYHFYQWTTANFSAEILPRKNLLPASEFQGVRLQGHSPPAIRARQVLCRETGSQPKNESSL